MSLFQAWAKAKRQGICPNRADRLANKSVIHPDKISVVQERPDGKQAWSQL